MDTGNDCRAEDQSLEAIKLLWMFINKHASDLNEGTKLVSIGYYSVYVLKAINLLHVLLTCDSKSAF